MTFDFYLGYRSFVFVVQYTYPRGSLLQSLAADDNSTLIRVSDGGLGIPIGYNQTYNDVFVRKYIIMAFPTI